MDQGRYVIDNRAVRLVEVIEGLLRAQPGGCVDVATAYFSVDGWALLADPLRAAGPLRLLLGAPVTAAEQVGLRPDPRAGLVALGADLARRALDARTERRVTELLRYLAREQVEVRRFEGGFLHAKAWLLYGQEGGRVLPRLGVVGSSNFTAGGLTSNHELNLVHRAVADSAPLGPAATAALTTFLPGTAPPELDARERAWARSEVGAQAVGELTAWFDQLWAESVDCKAELCAILDESQFGQAPWTPYDIYLKALSRYFAEPGDEAAEPRRTQVELAEFQEHAVRRAEANLDQWHGVLIADSVGLGKTWIGLKLLERRAKFVGKQALVLAPAALCGMWRKELRQAGIAAEVLSLEKTAQPRFEVREHAEFDIVVIDESHRLANDTTQTYLAVEQLLAHGGWHGPAGGRKEVVLLTATPINNGLFDLYNQLSLITGGDRGYFASLGIPDLWRYFRNARAGDGAGDLFDLLEAVVVRRHRAYIIEHFPEATLHGQPIRWPQRELHTQRYSLAETYGRALFSDIVERIEQLNLAPYGLSAYQTKAADMMDVGRQQGLIGIFKTLYLKRFESSAHAFRISIDRALAYQRSYAEQLRAGRLYNAEDWRRLRAERDDSDAAAEAAEALALDPRDYDLEAIGEAVHADIANLNYIAGRVGGLGPEGDRKWHALRAQLLELAGRKVLLFSYFRDTARYLHDLIRADAELLAAWGGAERIAIADSNVRPDERDRLVVRFAPRAAGRTDLADSPEELQLLVATDALSEGRNLQDCAVMINYDLHWAPTRMVQRAGRIDRIGSIFEHLAIHNYFPERELDELLRLVERLQGKINSIDETGLHDSSVLGEMPHPRAFGTLRRIAEEDAGVMGEEARGAELFGAEEMRGAWLKAQAGGLDERVAAMPDGIHSVRQLPRERGIFFAFEAVDPASGAARPIWVYRDHQAREFSTHMGRLGGLIAADPDEPRGATLDSVHDVLPVARQFALRRLAAAAAPSTGGQGVDQVQVRIEPLLSGGVPGLERGALIACLTFLSQPQPRFVVQALKAALRDYHTTADLPTLAARVADLQTNYARPTEPPTAPAVTYRDEDLKLVCYEYIG